MKKKIIKAIHCPYCSKAKVFIIDEDDDQEIEEISCDFCHKTFNLKELGLI